MFPATDVASAAIFGVLLHLGYFIHGEHHMQSPTIFRAVFLAPLIVFLIHLKLSSFSWSYAAIASLYDTAACYGALLLSMTIYRAFFHRTKNFPGPKLAGVTKLYHMFNVAPKSDQYRWLESMRQQYGDFVRTGNLPTRNVPFTIANKLSGPNEISIFTPDAVAVVYGPGSKCIRSDFYDMTKPLTSVVACRKPIDHSVQRKYWDMGFSVKGTFNHPSLQCQCTAINRILMKYIALKDYERRVYSYARTFVQDLEQNVNKPIAINVPIQCFVFDVMGNVIFGQHWNVIQTKEKSKFHEIIAIHTEAIGTLGPLTPVPWMFRILFSIQALLDGWRTFRAWAVDECNAMVQVSLQAYFQLNQLVY